MSASDKKKLRKEQNAAAMTDKQKQQAKEAKSLKTYTVTFIVAMVLVVVLIAGIALRAPVSGIINRNTVAATVNDHEVSVVELNYFYVDAIENFADSFSDYGDSADYYLQYYYGYSAHTPADEQPYYGSSEYTWADYFLQLALSNARWAYAMYDKAIAEQYPLSETEQEYLSTFEEDLEYYAVTYLGYSSTESYLRSVYGYGANVETYKEYYELTVTASEYAQTYYDGLTFTDEDYREFETDRYEQYSSYSFAFYSLNVKSYLEDSSNYTEEEYAAAVEAAEADAKILARVTNSTVDRLNAAVLSLEVNADNQDSTAFEITDVLYDELTETITDKEMVEWITAENRRAGSNKYFAGVTENSDGTTTTTSFTVILFLGSNDNKVPVANVRHLLVKFEGGTKDEETEKTVYSETEKRTAQLEAVRLMNEYKNGETVDEDAFIDLVKKYSDDSTASTGGLVEGVTPDAGYVENFTNWALEEHEAGDVAVIETEYGYHVMYYVSAEELNYRDTMIHEDLLAETYNAWQEEIVADYTLTALKTNGVDEEYVPG